MVAKLHALKAELRLQNARAGCRSRCMATKDRLLPIPCGPGEHRPVECFRATVAALVVAHSTPPSQRPVPGDRATRIFPRWIPTPRVLHPYPIARFLATHPRWEPYA